MAPASVRGAEHRVQSLADAVLGGAQPLADGWPARRRPSRESRPPRPRSARSAPRARRVIELVTDRRQVRPRPARPAGAETDRRRGASRRSSSSSVGASRPPRRARLSAARMSRAPPIVACDCSSTSRLGLIGLVLEQPDVHGVRERAASPRPAPGTARTRSASASCSTMAANSSARSCPPRRHRDRVSGEIGAGHRRSRSGGAGRPSRRRSRRRCAGCASMASALGPRMQARPARPAGRRRSAAVDAERAPPGCPARRPGAVLARAPRRARARPSPSVSSAARSRTASGLDAGPAHHVGAVVDAVHEVDVQVPRGAEHDRVAGGLAVRRMRRQVLGPEVRLDLDDAAGDPAAGASWIRTRAEQVGSDLAAERSNQARSPMSGSWGIASGASAAIPAAGVMAPSGTRRSRMARTVARPGPASGSGWRGRSRPGPMSPSPRRSPSAGPPHSPRHRAPTGRRCPSRSWSCTIERAAKTRPSTAPPSSSSCLAIGRRVPFQKISTRNQPPIVSPTNRIRKTSCSRISGPKTFHPCRIESNGPRSCPAMMNATITTTMLRAYRTMPCHESGEHAGGQARDDEEVDRPKLLQEFHGCLPRVRPFPARPTASLAARPAAGKGLSGSARPGGAAARRRFASSPARPRARPPADSGWKRSAIAYETLPSPTCGPRYSSNRREPTSIGPAVSRSDAQHLADRRAGIDHHGQVAVERLGGRHGASPDVERREQRQQLSAG